MVKYFYEETGMYTDWAQLEKLPEIDTLIDIGVGPDGTPDLYKRFKNQQLILIDPLDEAEKFFYNNMSQSNTIFFKSALGAESAELTINVEKDIGRSTLLNVSNINYDGEPIDRRIVKVKRLDDLLVEKEKLNRVGIKIDTEGFELNVIKGAPETLLQTKFVLAEVRHNHESFDGVYKLHEFIKVMHDNGFILSMILTAKPFIADLCFQPMADL